MSAVSIGVLAAVVGYGSCSFRNFERIRRCVSGACGSGCAGAAISARLGRWMRSET
jgi:hypothetical protein